MSRTKIAGTECYLVHELAWDEEYRKAFWVEHFVEGTGWLRLTNEFSTPEAAIEAWEKTFEPTGFLTDLRRI